MRSAGLVLTSHQDTLAKMMDVVANNVANASSTGFKRQVALAETNPIAPKRGTVRGDPLLFSLPTGSYRDATQGAVQITDNPLDVAIQGDGLLAVRTGAGVRYTRAGSFMLDVQGQLITPSGDPVLGEGNQPITFPPSATDITIARDGTITARAGGDTALTQVGRLTLVRVNNPEALVMLGNGLYDATQPPVPDTTSTLIQNSLERSNVEPVNEITAMIKVARAYELSARLLDGENQSMREAINKLGKVV